MTTTAMAVAALLGVPIVGAAQTAGGDGFLFKDPRVTLSLRGGWAMPRAGSEIFDFVRDELTLDRGDFDALTLGGELAARLSDRVEFTLGLDRGESRARSEFRDWVGNDDLPIEQTTDFLRTAFSVGTRVYLAPRGRSVSRFAWIPADFTPWVGGGVGYQWYDFVQDGEFVDFETFDIFFDRFTSDGSAPLAYLSGGVDVAVSNRWIVRAEGRYAWSSSEMDTDFVGFDDIDLSGFQASVGLGVRF
jgi:opacity protein-like surface antigen